VLDVGDIEPGHYFAVAAVGGRWEWIGFTLGEP
jgi:hypothetical protein